jgi:hypothetical protein
LIHILTEQCRSQIWAISRLLLTICHSSQGPESHKWFLLGAREIVEIALCHVLGDLILQSPHPRGSSLSLFSCKEVNANRYHHNAYRAVKYGKGLAWFVRKRRIPSAPPIAGNTIPSQIPTLDLPKSIIPIIRYKNPKSEA